MLRSSHRPPLSARAALALTCAAIVTALACGRSDRFDSYVGRLDQDSYAGQRWSALGPNGLGDEVKLADFEGRFLWVDYSAAWCGYCTRQAGVLRGLEQRLGDKIVFVTVVVNGDEPMTDPTAETAAAWAQRFGHDPRRVVAQRIYVGPIPHHFLFSPSGQTLYRRSGLHSAEQIEAALVEQMAAWNRWRAQHDVARR